jgi:hypothetical protein
MPNSRATRAGVLLPSGVWPQGINYLPFNCNPLLCPSFAFLNSTGGALSLYPGGPYPPTPAHLHRLPDPRAKLERAPSAALRGQAHKILGRPLLDYKIFRFYTNNLKGGIGGSRKDLPGGSGWPTVLPGKETNLPGGEGS